MSGDKNTYYIGETTEQVRLASIDKRISEIEERLTEAEQLVEEIMGGMIFHNLI